jgi:hypothetical protein
MDWTSSGTAERVIGMLLVIGTFLLVLVLASVFA